MHALTPSAMSEPTGGACGTRIGINLAVSNDHEDMVPTLALHDRHRLIDRPVANRPTPLTQLSAAAALSPSYTNAGEVQTGAKLVGPASVIPGVISL